MTEEIIIDVSGCSHKRDDDCMEVPICNEYGDLMGYQSCEAQTLCPYRSQKKIERLDQENKELKEEKDKYYQQTLDDEILMNELSLEVNLRKRESDFYLEKLSKYRSALEEILEKIKSLNKDICDNCGWYNTDNCQPNGYVCHDLIEIKNKINEVINEGK